VVFFSPSTDRPKPARYSFDQPTPENPMSTKKKAGAKASAKAAPVRRHKPGPAARRKARELRASLASSAAASVATGRAIGAARLARSPAELEIEQRAADIRLTNARAEETELLNRERARNIADYYPSTTMHFRGDEAEAIPLGGEPKHIGYEHGEFRNEQDDTDKLLAELHARLEPMLRSVAPDSRNGSGGGAAEAVRSRSPQAELIAGYANRQSLFNTRLRELLHRLDLSADGR
jgi:hypothetical protein